MGDRLIDASSSPQRECNRKTHRKTQRLKAATSHALVFGKISTFVKSRKLVERL
jgi:hypothetical protein